MKRTENLNLPIYDNPESDIFKINDVNNAHETIDKQYKELKNIKETVESTNPSANLQGQINDINASLETKANEIDLDVERKRIDSFVSLPNGSTSGDAELIDIRVGADGKTYANAGTSVRSQVGKVIDYKNHLNPNILFDNSFFSLASNWTISGGDGTITDGLNINVSTFPFKIKTQFINVSENIAYTIRLLYSANNEMGGTIAFYNSSNTYISQIDFSLPKNSTSVDKTFTTPSDTTKILILINGYSVDTVTLTGYLAQGNSISELNLTEYIENIATEIADNKSYKPLKNKTVLGIGDSLMEGAISGGGWIKILETDYGVIGTNGGVGGTTIATSSVTNPIWNRINNYVKNNYDYILLEGGINDYFTNVPIGIVKPPTETGYNSGTYDTSTFAGALEQLIKTCVTTWTDKKIIYIIPHKYLDGSPENLSRQKQYWDIAKEICNKWGISYVDLFNNSLLNGLIPSIRDNYFRVKNGQGDKLHPNEEGYRTQITNIVGKMLY